MKAKRIKRAPKQVRKHWIEVVVHGADRVNKVAKATWAQSAILPPAILSAVMRDILIEIEHVHGAGKNLQQDES